MPLPSVVRVFFAIDLPATIKEQIGEYICALKKKSRTNAIRWSRSENFHITLQFLPEVKSEHLPQLIEAVRANMLGTLQQTSISFGALQLFPTPYHPRVIVLEVKPQEVLAEMAKTIGEGIVAAHYDIDKRPFRAHLTLGRIKNPQGVKLDFLSEVAPIPIQVIDINEIILFRSEPQAEGSRYTVLERIVFD